MEKLLWIGCLESDEEFKIKSKKGYNLASAQVSQQNLIKGIEKVTGLTFDSINGSVLPPFPVYSDKVIKETKWSHTEGAFDVSVGYKNTKYVNKIASKRAMVKAVHKWLKTNYDGRELNVMVYSMRSSVMATACEIKKLVPTAKIYLIVTDLPQYMDLGQSGFKAFLKKIDWIFIKKMMSKFDGFILYASKMAEFLNISEDNWILMEGSYDASEITTMDNNNKPLLRKALMYSGMIEKKYGIELLVETFKTISDPNLELWITGGGNDVEYVKKCAKDDSRIKYFGFLPTRTDVLVKQQEATLLINMRLPSEKASRYCFPSKILEYMASGTPVLSFRLDGIPEKYYKYLIEIEEETVDSLRKAITSSLEVNNINRLGQSAREFILSEKNIMTQSEKIVNFVSSKSMVEIK